MSPKSWELGSVIREARNARRLTQAELAAQVGASEVSVSNWERGTTTPEYPNRVKLANVLQIPVSKLLEADNPASTAVGESSTESSIPTDEFSSQGAELQNFVEHIQSFVRMLSQFPTPLSAEAKIEFLNLYEQAAREAGQALPAEYWDIRRRIHEGDL